MASLELFPIDTPPSGGLGCLLFQVVPAVEGVSCIESLTGVRSSQPGGTLILGVGHYELVVVFQGMIRFTYRQAWGRWPKTTTGPSGTLSAQNQMVRSHRY